MKSNKIYCPIYIKLTHAEKFTVYNIYDRDPWFWIDQPPPEKDLELGIGRYVAWQTPLHREAVKEALREYR